MSDKQFPSPEKLEEAVGVRSGSKQDVYKVALYQKIFLISIALNLLISFSLAAFFPSGLGSPEVKPILTIALYIVFFNSAVGLVVMILLGFKIFHPINGVITAILVLVPLIGFLVVISINGIASKVLKENGFQVGLFGASLSKVRAWADKEATEA